MAKAYWVARVTVNDPEAYKRYVEGSTVAFAKYGGRFLARGGRIHPLEGNSRPRNVIIEFDSVEQAQACWDSPEYQAARIHRLGAAEAEMVVVEGIE
jgi:uncharacterized protein (DUF1330 family)